MIDKDLLEILACPQTHQPLALVLGEGLRRALCVVRVVEGDPRAAASEGEGHGLAQAGRGTGDEGDAACVVVGHGYQVPKTWTVFCA